MGGGKGKWLIMRLLRVCLLRKQELLCVKKQRKTSEEIIYKDCLKYLI